MFWITKYTHNKIVESYREVVKDLREALWRKEKFEEICEKLADKTLNVTACIGDTSCRTGILDIMDRLDDTVPRYVDDYFGGKVIRQEATPVTILDANGKATYALTKKAPDKGKSYLLIIN